MKLILVGTYFLLFSFVDFVDHDNVYICNSNTAKRYHLKKGCRGLKACKADIKEVTLKDALNRKRSLCKWED